MKNRNEALDAEQEFQDTLTEGLFGDVEHDSVEKALEKALDSTTPELPGDPRDFRKPRNAEPEWV